MSAVLHAARAPLLDDKRNADAPHSWIKELVAQLRLLLPIYTSNILEFGQGAFTVIVVGRLGVRELAAQGIAQLIQNSLIHALIIIGPVTALDTLCNSAYTSSSPHLTGLYAQRTAVIIFALLVPTMIAFSFAERFLLLIGQEPSLARLSGLALRISIWQTPFLAIFELTRKWLLAQGLVRVPTVIAIVTTPISCLLVWLLVLGPIDSLRIGFFGAPITVVCVQAVASLLAVAYCYFFVSRKAWTPLSSAIFRDLGPNIRLGFAGTLTIISEFWSWDGIALASSYLGLIAYSTNVISNWVIFCCYWLPLAIMSAGSIRIGNLLGEGDYRSARHAAKVSWSTGLGVGAVNAVLLWLYGRDVAGLFTREEAVIEAFSKSILGWIMLCVMFDDITAAAYGILRATGKADVAAKANIFGYWCLGIPIGIYLAFPGELGLSGLWIGNTISLVTIATTTTLCCIRIVWREVAAQALQRTMATDAGLEAARLSVVAAES